MPAALSYKLAWLSETKNWNRIVAVAPSGDVIAVGGRIMTVHAGDSGKILEQAEVCYGSLTNGFAFVDGSKGFLVCEDEVREIDFPGVASRTAFKLPSEAEAAAVTGHLVAVGDKQGQVNVYSTATWKPVDQFKIKGEVETLAFTPDGSRLAAGGQEGHIEARDLAAKKSSILSSTGSSRVSGLGFSPDGTEVFAYVKSFTAGVLDVQKATMIRSYEVSSWLTAVRYLSKTLVAATGAHGMALFSADSSTPHSLSNEIDKRASFEGLGASDDGSLVCAGDRDGRIACFTSRALSPSTYKPAPRSSPGSGSAGSASGAAAASAPEIAGSIVSRKGNVLTIRTTAGFLPPVDAKATLYRRFEQQLGPISASGWLEVAKVIVKKAAPGSIDVTIAEEKSTILLNGKKVNHFGSGADVKLMLTP
jgi:hypothetical protein